MFVLAEGAVSNEPAASRKTVRGQRKPKQITIETYTNQMYDVEGEFKGVLPKSSREQTPLDELPPSIPEFSNEINFFSGNPFVEVTKGILHLYKKK